MKTSGGTGMATGFGPHMGFRYGIMGLVLGLSLMQVDLKAHHREEPSKKAGSKPASDRKPWWQRVLPLGKAKGKQNEGTQALSQSVQQRWTGPGLTPTFEKIEKEAQPVGAPPILSGPVAAKDPAVEKPAEPVAKPAEKTVEKPARKERRQVLGQKSRKKKDEPEAAAPVAPETPAAPVVDEKAKKKADRDARWAEKRARRKAEKAPRPDSAIEEAVAPEAAEENPAPVEPSEPAEIAEAVEPTPAPAKVPAIETDPAKGEAVKADPAGLYVRPDPRVAEKIRALQAKKRQMLMDGGSTYQIRKVDAVIAEMRRTGTIPDGL